MGLDNYFVKTKGEEGLRWPCVSLVQSANPGHERAAFRGEVYNDLFLTVTGHTLYQQCIETQEIAIMADALLKQLDQWIFVYEGGARCKKCTVKDWFFLHEVLAQDHPSFSWMPEQLFLRTPTYNRDIYEMLDLLRLFRFAAAHDMRLLGWW